LFVIRDPQAQRFHAERADSERKQNISLPAVCCFEFVFIGTELCRSLIGLIQTSQRRRIGHQPSASAIPKSNRLSRLNQNILKKAPKGFGPFYLFLKDI